jgi:uncharacterized protein (TIGR00255 family)
MLSMTGYGRGSAPLGPRQIIVDVRTVNHRFLELRLHVSHELASQSATIEDCVRQYTLRGRVDVTVRLEGAPLGAISLDHGRARAAFDALRELRDQLAPSDPLPLGLLSSVPGLFRETAGADESQRDQACLAAAQAACRELLVMRRAEGGRLADDLLRRGARISGQLEALTPTLPRLVEQQRLKLSSRIAQLLSATQVTLDHGRLEHEVALLADRADVSEELTRLSAHAAAIEALLRTDSEHEPVGHRLDFLLQEMSREANTAAAKLPDAAATQTMLEVKAELLRMREQVQNVL